MLTTEQMEFLLPRACNAAIRAGAAIMEIYDRVGDYDVMLKEDKSPLTLADREAHSVIRSYLAPTRIPLLSEEGREMLYEERREWDIFWMVDPLDGTKEFIKRNGEFTVNIALMVGKRPALGIIYVPFLEKLYFADMDTGTFLINDMAADPGAEFTLKELTAVARMLPLTDKANKPIRVAISRSHNTDETFWMIDILKRKFPDLEVIQQGSSYKFCLLAEGAVDCYIRTSNTYEWDTAAGEAILEAAGGRILTLPDKEPMEYNQMTLLNPHFVGFSKFMPHRI